MVIGQGGNASGDVSVFREGDTYYMFCTGGGAWTSDNMLDWSFSPVRNVPVAPDVVKYRGKFYMSGNDCPLYVADNPLGPYEVLGDWENTPDVEGGWNGAFDMHIFIDNDKPYLLYSGRGISGIFIVPLELSTAYDAYRPGCCDEKVESAFMAFILLMVTGRDCLVPVAPGAG